MQFSLMYFLSSCPQFALLLTYCICIVNVLQVTNQYKFIVINLSNTYIIAHYVMHNSLSFPKHMSCIYHQSSIQTILTTLKIFCFPPFYPSSLHPNSWKPLIILLSLSVPFPDCHIIIIIWCISFKDCLVSLSNMYLIFLCLFVV